MTALMRFPSAVRRDAGVDAWFSTPNHEMRRLVEPWFERMRHAKIRWGEPVNEAALAALIAAAYEDIQQRLAAER